MYKRVLYSLAFALVASACGPSKSPKSKPAPEQTSNEKETRPKPAPARPSDKVVKKTPKPTVPAPAKKPVADKTLYYTLNQFQAAVENLSGGRTAVATFLKDKVDNFSKAPWKSKLPHSTSIKMLKIQRSKKLYGLFLAFTTGSEKNCDFKKKNITYVLLPVQKNGKTTLHMHPSDGAMFTRKGAVIELPEHFDKSKTFVVLFELDENNWGCYGSNPPPSPPLYQKFGDVYSLKGEGISLVKRFEVKYDNGRDDIGRRYSTKYKWIQSKLDSSVNYLALIKKFHEQTLDAGGQHGSVDYYCGIKVYLVKMEKGSTTIIKDTPLKKLRKRDRAIRKLPRDVTKHSKRACKKYY